ncbi:hypothetical protein [Piscinibacter gummiphilus]|uniref:Uncharacterized protein n=1 Tax=Piscinibacter gummiphilus TaxID=946333 RepID=A0ABZ0CLZ2_9BURK|nr:hypothetical protein [Piscinibacter gummiphilus]WOB06002.1 hypothetical protein RXV79_13830 [Piscinibacter gummiphilus]
MADDACAPITAEMQEAAQADADRFYGDTPVPPWPSGHDDNAPSPWPWGLAGAVLLLGAAAAFVATRYVDDLTTPRSAHITPTREATSPTGDPDEDLIDEPVPASRPAGQAPMQPGSRQFTVSHQRREWRIEAHGASRLLVAQRLAEATGSSLRGDLSLLDATRPLDLQWQGRRAAQAWQAVLGQELSFLTQCSGSRCRVWLLQAGNPDDIVFRLPPQRPVIPLPSADASGAAAAITTRQSDSADPRVAAHHD